jgi:hypothetical protein
VERRFTGSPQGDVGAEPEWLVGKVRNRWERGATNSQAGMGQPRRVHAATHHDKVNGARMERSSSTAEVESTPGTQLRAPP